MYICDNILRDTNHQRNTWPYLSYRFSPRSCHTSSPSPFSLFHCPTDLVQRTRTCKS